MTEELIKILLFSCLGLNPLTTNLELRENSIIIKSYKSKVKKMPAMFHQETAKMHFSKLLGLLKVNSLKHKKLIKLSTFFSQEFELVVSRNQVSYYSFYYTNKASENLSENIDSMHIEINHLGILYAQFKFRENAR